MEQKGRKIPLQLQSAVEQEMKKLLKEGHIERTDKFNDNVFIHSVVFTLKKDSNVKIALDAALNKAIREDKYQMPNLDRLMEQVAEIINEQGEGEVIFASLLVRYAYGQTDLHPETARRCNF